ncbi:MAG: hypothetical protein IAG10_07540, partial [Planctomycetaceae bacterium]|nr:hypothetical protein [Planctomycetaceae bacterium]
MNLAIVIKDDPSDPEVLSTRINYAKTNSEPSPSGGLQVTGILSRTAQDKAKRLSISTDWAPAFDRIAKQPQNIFSDVLALIFPEGDTDAQKAKKELLGPDTFEKDDGRSQTASQKRITFIRHFLPLLRTTLRQRLIVSTLSSATGLSADTANVLLCDVLKLGTGPNQKAAVAVLENIKEQPAEETTSWKGYLIPPTDDSFTFFAVDDHHPPTTLQLDGVDYAFTNRQEDPDNVWFTAPTTKLKAGYVYQFEVRDRSAIQLQWKMATSARSFVPTSALLPDHVSQDPDISAALSRLFKAAVLINGFGLNADEVSFLQSHGSDFDGLDFNAVDFARWRRLESYVRLRNSLPKLETTLLDLFTWAAKPDASKTLSEQICGATNWHKEKVDKLLAENHFDLNHPEKFKNEVSLLKLQFALKVADKIGIDIGRLFEWAKPSSKFWPCHKIAEDIRLTVRSRFDQESWEQVVKPLNDQLRRNQREALVNYLVVQPVLREWGVIDADSLFEFFLIDVQMECCMETSRIKQAISSVQLFVQRSFMGLEEKHGVHNNALDRGRWEWMQKYRVWEANRKVFLYPENWLDPHLRDDKSPFFKEFESELLQKDLNPQTISDAITNYLYKVDEVANMKVVGLFVENPQTQDNTTTFDKLHVFSRTRNAPYFFYYRYFDGRTKDWYPWERMQVDIPTYDVEVDGKITNNGAYLIPVVWNQRLLVFFPQITKKTMATSTVGDEVKFEDGNATIPTKKPLEYWEVKLGWSEYRYGKWTQKQMSSVSLYPEVVEVGRYKIYQHTVTTSPAGITIHIFPRAVIHTGGVFGTRVPVAFTFDANAVSVSALLSDVPDPFGVATDFHYRGNIIHSLQSHNNESNRLFAREPYFSDRETTSTFKYGSEFIFAHQFTNRLVADLSTRGLPGLFDVFHRLQKESEEEKGNAFGSDSKAKYHELKRPYSLYNWEAAFHAPMLIADRLLKSRQLEEALKMCHYVLTPLAEGTGNKRFWMFPPFEEAESENVLAHVFGSLMPNRPDTENGINAWRDKPFQPHVVARSRPSAYMKWVAMKYIEILIAYGDFYFRQNTLETIPLAIQCYVQASHIYAPRSQKIPPRGKILPQTYRSLLDKWDAFGNAMVELE